MERRYTLEGGGSLTVQADGLRAVLTAERASDSRGLYKAYLRGLTGRALLGTLVPENGRLRIRRTLTLDALERQGAWPPVGGEQELAFAFGGEKAPDGWCWMDPERLTFGEEALRAMAVRQGRMLFRRVDGGFQLAYPVSCCRGSSAWPGRWHWRGSAMCAFASTGRAGQSSRVGAAVRVFVDRPAAL